MPLLVECLTGIRGADLLAVESYELYSGNACRPVELYQDLQLQGMSGSKTLIQI